MLQACSLLVLHLPWWPVARAKQYTLPVEVGVGGWLSDGARTWSKSHELQADPNPPSVPFYMNMSVGCPRVLSALGIGKAFPLHSVNSY